MQPSKVLTKEELTRLDVLLAELSVCDEALAAKRGKVPADEERRLRRDVLHTIRRINGLLG